MAERRFDIEVTLQHGKFKKLVPYSKTAEAAWLVDMSDIVRRVEEMLFDENSGTDMGGDTYAGVTMFADDGEKYEFDLDLDSPVLPAMIVGVSIVEVRPEKT